MKRLLEIGSSLNCGAPGKISEQTGREFKQGDVVSMANEIMKLKEHPIAPSVCRKRAEKYFDKNRCFEEYIELYKAIV
ncbi:MAG: hypothetical protein HUK00_00085 [Bacteroidaceae bacterium]|nr:hypothetical protein [Bacteroidaceae bacterium]